MEMLLAILKRWIAPPAFIRIILILAGFGSLIPAFWSPLSETAFVYAAYTLSAWALASSAVWAVKAGRSIKNAGIKRVREHRLAARYASDHYFRVSLGLAGALFVNLGYAGLKAVTAIVFSSRWTGFIAAYYIALSGVRLYLMTKFLKEKEHDPEKEISIYRRTAIFLLLMNLALTVLIDQIVHEGETYTCPGTIIFVYAGYTLYSFGSSAYHMVKYRRFQSPLLSAVKTVGFTTALVSVLSLQTAMLTRFGAESEAFHRLANRLTGTAVSGAILMISIFMLIPSNIISKKKRSCST